MLTMRTRPERRLKRWRALLQDARHWKRVSAGYRRRITPAPHKPDPSTWPDDALTLSWLGHSTLLINVFGVWILTDPALLSRVGIRAGPVTLGPKRFIAPALRVRQLPRIDIVLLTHAHMDHLDIGTLRKLPRDLTVVTAKSTRDLLRRLKFREVIELEWGERRRFDVHHRRIEIEAFEVRHWGARLRHDVHRGFNGYLLERKGCRVGITGDTARTDLTAIGRRGRVDVMAVPIGAYNPWIMSHCTPEQAVAMANEARAQYVVPIHHQTFRLGREPMDEPIRRFRKAIDPARIALSEVGETFVVPTG
jgi:L-ascorbate metabolism protein UlaG (beta-lactamase superfamily)